MVGNNENPILRTSLRCFKQPIVWVAIGLLLLNDQYLKAAYPSWWTGKLSDVAGLFFFPFIVTAVFGLITFLFEQHRLKAEQTGRFAFLLVGLWFAFMKMNPAVNALTVTLWEWLAGGPVFIVMDGSDLLALPVLIPAWRLWRGQLRDAAIMKKGQRSIAWDWRVWLVGGTAVFAGTASACDRYYFGHIYQLIEVEGTIYALSVVDDFSDTRIGNFFAHYQTFTNSWEEIDDVPQKVMNEIDLPVPLPVMKCVSDNNAICYQIIGDERILSSNDGGQTWKTAWRIPAGRRFYMERGNPDGLCRGNINMGPYDLIVTGTAASHRVVAAFGTEGVVMKHLDGSWERQGLLSTFPAPIRGFTLLDVINKAFFELAAIIMIGTTFSVGQFFIFLRHTALLIITLIFILVFALILQNAVFMGGVVLILILVALSRGLGNRYKIDRHEQIREAVKVWIGSTICLFFVGIVLIYSWVLAVIPFYWLMMTLFVGSAVIITIWTVRRNLQLLAESQETAASLDGT